MFQNGASDVLVTIEQNQATSKAKQNKYAKAAAEAAAAALH
jgi:hypothetical protein